MKQNGSMTQQRQTNGKNGYFRRPRKHDTQIGTGASLLNRKARGAVGNGLGRHLHFYRLFLRLL